MTGDMEKENKGKDMGVRPMRGTVIEKQTISSVKESPPKQTAPYTEPSARPIN